MNPFVEMNYATGVWNCPLCGQDNVAPKKDLHQGSYLTMALQSACVEYRQPPQDENGEDATNYMTQMDDEDFCTYVLVVDENLAPCDGQAIAPAVEALLKDELNSEGFPKARIGLVTFAKTVSVHHLGLSGLTSSDVYTPPDPTKEITETDMLASDTEKRAYLAEMQPGQAFHAMKNALSSIFDVVTNENSDNSSMFGLSPRMSLLAKKKEARIRKERQGNGVNHNPVESPWVKVRTDAKAGRPIRCTGDAVQCALDLASAAIAKPSRTARVILFTSGCPNSGEGSVVALETANDKMSKRLKRPTHDVVDTALLQKSVEYFDMTATFAVSTGVGFDVFCSGVTELALPAYQALVEPSGGYVLPLVSFTTPRFEHDLKFLLKNTYMSRSKFVPDDLDAGGAECILDIRTDSFTTPTQLCGSGEVLLDQVSQMVENERPAFAEGCALAAEQGFKTNKLPSTEAMNNSLTRIQVGRVDPLTTFAILLEVDDIGEEDDFVFFQLVSRYISRKGGEEITRVCSFRLPVAKDISDFVSSVDDEAVSVLLAKSAVYRALHGREETSSTRDIAAVGDSDTQEKLAYETQLDLDATVQRISGAFRLMGLEEKMRRFVIMDFSVCAAKLQGFIGRFLIFFFFFQ
jgi:hypothetical protein